MSFWNVLSSGVSLILICFPRMMESLWRATSRAPTNKLLHTRFSSWQETVSFAPMMDFTNKHQRTFQRLITKSSMLYTEMVTCNAIAHSPDAERLMRADFDIEHPLTLQLGGSSVSMMKEATVKAFKYGYKHINLNCGCPSPKVAGSGNFGVSLMHYPTQVADMCAAIADITQIPATVKCRIGVDNNDSYEELVAFVSKVCEQGAVYHFIIHARKALLNFSPG
jgi:tRNA-dihydrouridine synthase A